MSQWRVEALICKIFNLVLSLIMYCNARSLIPKYDELCATMEVHNPDTICIVETWLCAAVLDSEVALSGYQIHRKRSTIVPIPKTSPTTSPECYRPVSLLSVLSKVLERHVYDIITNHLQAFHPPAESQWGFLPAGTGLLMTTYNWLNWLNTLESGGEIGAVFFHLQNAFDSIPHSVLLEKIRLTGLSGPILSWISDYLTCREQKVVVNGEESRYTSVVSGVPQGSVLGPLLFLVFVDGLAKLPLLDGGQIVLYADNLLLLRSIKSQEEYIQLQSDVSMVEDWDYLSLNSAKCKYMVVLRKR